ncbi:MAG: Ig-like domain-containing protein [bacterium]
MKRFSKKDLIIVFFILFVLSSFQAMTIPVNAQLTEYDIQTLHDEILSNGYTFTVGLNPATERSIHDLSGLVPPANWQSAAEFKAVENRNGGYLPSTFNWTDENPVRDQGNCRSCWAFSTASVLESAIKISSGETIDLSEQYLISCNCDNWDCTNGGWFAHDYHKSKNCADGEEAGAVLETEIPYGASAISCTGSYTHSHKIIDWAFILSSSPIPSVSEIKQAIVNYGPISAAVVADSFFQAYTGGVFEGCIDDVDRINHAVVLTGWCDDVMIPSGGYWYLKNSWGKGWGENGYMRIAYGANCVGYAANFITPAVAPVAYFTGSPTVGVPPLTVQFTDLSLYNPTSWSWDFGEGSVSSEQNPLHIFTDPGIYTVTLTAHNALGASDALVLENYIAVVENTRTFCDSFDNDDHDWDAYKGIWTVVNNKYDGFYNNKGFSFDGIGMIEKATIALDWTSLSGGQWLMGRIDFGWENEANFRCIEMKDGENKWHIRKYVNGVRYDLASISDNIETNKEYHLEVKIDENGGVTLYVNGVEKLFYDFGAPVLGRLGVGVDKSKCRFDNICITVDNKTPEADDDSLITDEDQAISSHLNAFDEENDTLTYSIVTPAVKGIVDITDAATGAFTYTPDENVSGDDSFTFKVNDGTIDSNIATVMITINPVNDAPVIMSQAPTTAIEDETYTYNAIALDIDNDDLIWSLLNAPDGMSIDSSTGVITWIPGEGVLTSDIVILTVDDGQGDSDTEEFTISVTPVNDAPTINGIPQTSVLEDTLYSFTPVAEDVEVDTLVFSIENKPEWAAFDPATGTLSGTPGNADVGITQGIVIGVSDSQLSAALPAFDLAVINFNDEPVASDSAINTDEDVAAEGLLLAHDIDGDALTFSLLSACEKGTVTVFDSTTGAFTYTPDENVYGNDRFTFKVNDGTIDSTIATVMITINPINDAPVITSQAPTTATEDETYTYNATALDIDNDSLIWSLSTAPDGMSIDSSTGAITWTAGEGVLTSDMVTLTVDDGQGGSDTEEFTITVTPVNDAPTISGIPPASVLEDTLYSFTPVAEDVEGDTLVFSIENKPAWAAFDPATGTLSGTPGNADVGMTLAIVMRVSDSQLDAALPAFDLTVINVNDDPVASDIAISTDEDAAAEGLLLAHDIDGDALTFILLSACEKGTLTFFDSATGAFAYTPNENMYGDDSFTFKVNDGTIDSNIATVMITINPVNDPPVITSQAPTAATEDETYTYNAQASDIDNDSLTWSLRNAPDGMSINSSTGVIAWTPGEGVLTSGTVSITVDDGKGGSDSEEFTITVTPVNEAPIISGISPTSTLEDTPYSFTPVAEDVDLNTRYNDTLAAYEVDSDTLVFSIENKPAWAEFDPATGTLSGTPGNADVGITQGIVISVSDSQLEAALPAFDLAVINVNDQPVASNTAVSTHEDVDAEGFMLAHDIDGDALTFILLSACEKGTVIYLDNKTGAFIYAPNENVYGNDSFTFKVNDGNADSAIATVMITINPVNDAPSADPQTVETDSTKEIAIVLTASDPDGDALNYTIDTTGLQGSLAGSAPNLTYTPASGFVGTDSFSFTAHDGELESNRATVSIIVNSDAPHAFVTITMKKKIKESKKKATWEIEAEVRITDDAGDPLAGTQVEGIWSDSKKDSVTKKTDKKGKATFKSDMKDTTEEKCFTILRVWNGIDYTLEGELEGCVSLTEKEQLLTTEDKGKKDKGKKK